MSKDLIFGTEASKRIMAGVNTATDAVSVTLGPKGRNVLISRQWNFPMSTKDGATVAREIELPDPVENLGAKLISEASSKTDETYGDGTTTTAVLTQIIASRALRHISAGASPIALIRGMKAATKNIIDIVKGNSEPCEGTEAVRKIAFISSNRDETIADIVTDAISEVGADGTIEIQNEDDINSKLEVVEGLKFDRGYSHPAFLSVTENQIELDYPTILVIERDFSNLNDLTPLFEVMEIKNLLIIANKIEGDVLSVLLFNNAKGVIKACGVESPGFGDLREGIMSDIAILTGTSVISSSTGYSIPQMAREIKAYQKDPQNAPKPSFLPGSATKVIIDRDTTRILEGKGKPELIQERIDTLHETAKDKDPYNKKQLTKRAGGLGAGIAIIKVGGRTEAERDERKMRVEDALAAARAASKGGLVLGGGIALLKASKTWKKTLDMIGNDMTPDVKTGHDIIIRACQEPLWRIAHNAGYSGDYSVHKILESVSDHLGLDAMSGKFVNMKQKGILDPCRVVTASLNHAVSTASMITTLGCSITETVDKDND